MKKSGFLIVLLIMGSTVFAQQFSVNGHLATNFEGVRPTFGMELSLNKVDILAGFSFWIYKNDRSYTNYSSYNFDNAYNEYWVRIFAGTAPKVLLNDTITLSFPLMAKIQFRNDSLEYDSDNVYATDSAKKAEYFGYGFDAGVRLYFTFTDRWSIYTGAIMNVLHIHDNKYIYWNNSATATYTLKNSDMTWFPDGEVELGARFTF